MQMTKKYETQTNGKHIKICSTPLIIRETQSNATMRYHFASVKTATIKTKTHRKQVLIRYGETVTLVHCL